MFQSSQIENSQIQQNPRVFDDIREQVMTQKVDKALFKLQQIEDQKYALKFLGLKFFLKNIAKFTQSYMQKNLTKLHKHLIRDISTAENNTSQSYIYQQLNKILNQELQSDEKMKFWQKLLSLIPLFSPSNTLLIIWDITQVIFVLLFFYSIPLQITFQNGLATFMSAYLFNGGIVIFIMDNLITLNTAFYEKGIQIKDRYLVFCNFMKNHFIIDFVSNIPVIVDYFIIHLSGIWGFIMLLQYLKQNRISLIIRKLEEFFHLTPTQQQLVSLAKLLLTVLFIAHIFACIWVYIAIPNTQQQMTWLSKQGYQEKPWFDQYLLAFYFSTVTMITVGYGDVLPTNSREYILCVVTMLISCGVFAYAVNQIGSIFELLGRQDKQLKETMYRISNYMYIKKVSKELQYEVRQYLQYYWLEEQNRDTEQEEKIINQLSDKLKESLVLEANNLVLKDSVIFKNNFSENLIKKTVPLITESRITPEEFITVEGEPDECCIFFIEKGEVEVYLDQQSENMTYTQQIQKLKSGDSFGVVSFFTGNCRQLSIRSLDFTTLLSIKRSDFLDLLKDFPEDYEQFCFIKEKIIMCSDYRQIGTRCYSCGDFRHLCLNCPFIHYQPRKYVMLKKKFRSIQQIRQVQIRKRNRFRFDSNTREEIRQKAFELVQENSQIIEDLYGDNDNSYSSEENNDTMENNAYLFELKLQNLRQELKTNNNQKKQSIIINQIQDVDLRKNSLLKPNQQQQPQNESLGIQVSNIPSNNSQFRRSLSCGASVQQEINLQNNMQSYQQEINIINNEQIGMYSQQEINIKNCNEREGGMPSFQELNIKNNEKKQEPVLKLLEVEQQQPREKSTSRQRHKKKSIESFTKNVSIQSFTNTHTNSYSRQSSQNTSKGSSYNNKKNKKAGDRLTKDVVITKNLRNNQQNFSTIGSKTSINNDEILQNMQEAITQLLKQQQNDNYNASENNIVIEGSDNQKNIFSIDNIDSLKIFMNYYPNFNFDMVLQKYVDFQQINLNRQINGLKSERNISNWLKKINNKAKRNLKKNNGTNIIHSGQNAVSTLIKKIQDQEEQEIIKQQSSFVLHKSFSLIPAKDNSTANKRNKRTSFGLPFSAQIQQIVQSEFKQDNQEEENEEYDGNFTYAAGLSINNDSELPSFKNLDVKQKNQ